MGERINLPSASQRVVLRWVLEQRAAALQRLIVAKGDDVIREQQAVQVYDRLRTEVEREEREERQRGGRRAVGNA